MNPISLYPLMQTHLLEEHRRELERERELQRRIRETRAARRAARPSRFAIATARLRQAVRPVRAVDYRERATTS